MLRIRHSRAFPRAFGFIFVAACSLAAVGVADAKSRSVKAMIDEAPVMAAPAPLRFFTINSVLAKHDAKAGSPAQTRVASAVYGDVVSDAPASKLVPETSDEPFGLFVFRAPEGLLWTKWRAIGDAMATERDQIERCRIFRETCSEPADRFVEIVDNVRPLPDRARIDRVNAMVNNAVRYVSDYAQHGVADRWTAPLATLAAGQGDCEDYAIAKYALLREAGVAESDLRLLLVKDRAVRQDHAVLAVRLDARWLVLDNRRDTPMETADLRHFLPLFTLDSRGVNLFAAPYASRALHESETDILPASDREVFGGALRELPPVL
ncbi:transglutaminase-like cysteine peptidase [Afipia clevelandensis]|uniref:Transglutaminase-like domain-containing protein n=1 Tax=Afipia clevelandensis ATCC 49720 TaxID=883079 RepID=K8PK99_9BRAD|nr:transglutaminase-like cysteine peptidase [Afipia clevelandensis]EKS39950.1 hypothetical protein HMPREF9696_00962 [Afipia clevelandensis ATCC 49720]